jgi:hypothetical protein
MTSVATLSRCNFQGRSIANYFIRIKDRYSKEPVSCVSGSFKSTSKLKNDKMKNLQIDEKTALQLYPNATTEFKAMLNDTFGEKFFQRKITDRVKTFEDACDVLGITVLTSFYEGGADEIAYKKLKVIIKALNEGWAPDWDDSNEPKYYPWFYMNKPGFRLDYVSRYYDRSTVGSRLCFQKQEVAEYAAKQFFDLYKTFFTA